MNMGAPIQAGPAIDKPCCGAITAPVAKVRPAERALKREAGEDPALCPQL
jgi:hypothetical protein